MQCEISEISIADCTVTKANFTEKLVWHKSLYKHTMMLIEFQNDIALDNIYFGSLQIYKPSIMVQNANSI